MPVRSLTQSFWRWPTPEQKQKVPVLLKVGVFGRSCHGNDGFGRDLDLLIADLDAEGGQIDRLQRWPFEPLPLSWEARVLSPAELQRDLRWLP